MIDGVLVQNNPINFIDPYGLFFIYDKSDQQLTWYEDEAGWTDPPSQSWSATSGPYGSGALPDGWYYLTGEEDPAQSENNSMTDTCDNTYKYRLHPQFNTDRTGLLIHPDGGVPGTAGCVGGKGCTGSLRDFLKTRLGTANGRGNPSTGNHVTVLVRP